MTQATQDPAAPKWMRWTGLALSGLAIAFLLMDASMKLMRLPIVLKTTAELGWPVSSVLALGVVLLGATTLYAIPRTSVLGAVLLTGYLGGAVATHVRIESPLFSHILFGVYIGLLVWGGLYLRDARLRALFPLRK